MSKSQQKPTAADQAAHEEVVDKLVNSLGMKLSKAERKALVSGKKVSLANRSLSEFGSILIRAEALRHSSGETIIIRDLTEKPKDEPGSPPVTPFLKIACVKVRRVRCCAEVGWPPYVGISCEGTF